MADTHSQLPPIPKDELLSFGHTTLTLEAYGSQCYEAGIVAAYDRLMRAAPTHRHIKRGTTYVELFRGRLQCDEPPQDMDVLVTYYGTDGEIWHRAPVEFDDPRRFEVIKYG